VKPESTCHISTSESRFSHLYARVQKRPAETHPAQMTGRSDGNESGQGTAALSSNLTELDNLLAELSSSQFVVPASANDRQPASCMTSLVSLCSYPVSSLFFTVYCIWWETCIRILSTCSNNSSNTTKLIIYISALIGSLRQKKLVLSSSSY